MSKAKLAPLQNSSKAETNPQASLTDIMLKMVEEQRQTNKLLRNLINSQKKQSSSEKETIEESKISSRKRTSSIMESSKLRNVIEKQLQDEKIDWEHRDNKPERTLERIEKIVKDGQKATLKRLENIDKNGTEMVALLSGNMDLFDRKPNTFGHNSISLRTKVRLGDQISKPQQIEYIEREKMDIVAEKSKNYSILKEILPFSDKRQIKAKISFKQILKNPSPKSHPNIENQTSEWLGVVYQVTASICSNMLFNNLLTFDETKILFTENIIYNYIEFMKEIHELGYDKERFHLTSVINEKSGYILNFLCKKYPQTKIETPNIALKSLIVQINDEERIKYDLLAQSGGIKKSLQIRDYASQIMEKINFMIDKTNEQYDIFENFMKNIFEEVYLTPQIREKKIKQNFDPLMIANKSTFLTAEEQKYKQKVQSYTKYLIGRKIPKNTEKYTEEEIQDGVFFIKSPAILRILVKWVEQLLVYVEHPEKKLKNSYSQFKDHQGNPLYIFSPVKNGVYNLIIAQRQKELLNKLEEIKQECFKMEALLTEERYITNEGQKHLSQEQTSVGKYCNNLKSAISSILCSQLNEVIEFLLSIPLKVDVAAIGIQAEYMQNQARKDLLNLNLVTLRLFDLLRCKCTSNQEEMVWIMKRLLDLSHQKKSFKIVRMKDRLHLGTRDILINAQINGGMVCQIQLSVSHGSDKKQELFDKYNHFLYELKRSILGPVTENVSIWTTLEQRSQYFEQEINRSKSRVYHKYHHECGSGNIRNFVRPIICKFCKNFYAIPETSLRNIKCNNKQCEQTFCGECFYESLNEFDKKKYIFQNLLKDQELRDLEEYKDESKPFPVSGFFIKKNFLKKQLAYYIAILKNKHDPNVKHTEIMLIQTVIRHDKLLNRQINKKQIKVRVAEDQFFLEKKMRETELKNMMIFYFKPKTFEKMFKNIEELEVAIQQPQNKEYHILDILRQPSYIARLSRTSKQGSKLHELEKVKKDIGNQTLVIYKLKNTFLLCQVFHKGDELRTSIIAKNNLNQLREHAKKESEIVSMENRDMTNEMDQIEIHFGPSLFSTFVVNIRKLYLNSGRISSIKCLAKLVNLSILYIAHNQLSNLQGIEKLTNLALIRFDDNQVEDMKPLNNLLQLKSVLGNGNKLKNCRGLENLKKLKKLSIYENSITDTKELANLQNLEQLFIKDNPFQSLNSVTSLSKLVDLSVGYTKIKNVPSLHQLKSLKSLALDGIGLQKIPDCFKNIRLGELWLSHNMIKKIENLEDQTQLKHLSLKANLIEKIENLDNLKKIELLNLSTDFFYEESNNIKKLENLEEILDTLKLFNVRKNPLQDISGFISKDFSARFTLTVDKLKGNAISQFKNFSDLKGERFALFFQ